MSTSASADRWESTLVKFDADPTRCNGGSLFVGSSIIRLWSLQKFFPGRRYLNRGFGGACLSDVIAHYRRLFEKHSAREVVLYAGDNDLEEGVPPSEIVELTARLVALIEADAPMCRIVLIPIKPSARRWSLRHAQRIVVDGCQKRLPGVVHVPPLTQFLNADGEPETRYLCGDGLHLNEEGYVLLTSIVTPWLFREGT
jgi:lysophospholipase L1-like esterase